MELDLHMVPSGLELTARTRLVRSQRPSIAKLPVTLRALNHVALCRKNVQVLRRITDGLIQVHLKVIDVVNARLVKVHPNVILEVRVNVVVCATGIAQRYKPAHACAIAAVITHRVLPDLRVVGGWRGRRRDNARIAALISHGPAVWLRQPQLEAVAGGAAHARTRRSRRAALIT